MWAWPPCWNSPIRENNWSVWIAPQRLSTTSFWPPTNIKSITAGGFAVRMLIGDGKTSSPVTEGRRVNRASGRYKPLEAGCQSNVTISFFEARRSIALFSDGAVLITDWWAFCREGLTGNYHEARSNIRECLSQPLRVVVRYYFVSLPHRSCWGNTPDTPVYGGEHRIKPRGRYTTLLSVTTLANCACAEKTEKTMHSRK